jgi:acetyltransferase-like isoleucine patch superfamily enzyme
LYNRFLFKKKKIVFGEGMQVYNRVYIRGNGTITIGNDFLFTNGDSINPICRNIRGCLYTSAHGNIVIGDHVGISSACIWAKEEIRIGDHVNIGGDCLIMDTDAHPIDYLERRKPVTNDNTPSLPIHIKDDVWIGARCIILKGVTIGERTVIGAGSVVTSDIPADCIAAGNPCRKIRMIER